MAQPQLHESILDSLECLRIADCNQTGDERGRHQTEAIDITRLGKKRTEASWKRFHPLNRTQSRNYVKQAPLLDHYFVEHARVCVHDARRNRVMPANKLEARETHNAGNPKRSSTGSDATADLRITNERVLYDIVFEENGTIAGIQPLFPPHKEGP